EPRAPAPGAVPSGDVPRAEADVVRRTEGDDAGEDSGGCRAETAGQPLVGQRGGGGDGGRHGQLWEVPRERRSGLHIDRRGSDRVNGDEPGAAQEEVALLHGRTLAQSRPGRGGAARRLAVRTAAPPRRLQALSAEGHSYAEAGVSL